MMQQTLTYASCYKTSRQTQSSRMKPLFVSYGNKNQVFAKWLARQLAFYGYGV